MLLAFDRYHREDGTADERRSEFYVPNDFVLSVSAEHADVFRPAVSIHPYRADAVLQLRRCRELGARLVKWLPNSQGMDPLSPRCDPFYDALREAGMVLLCHTGKERALRETAGEEPGTRSGCAARSTAACASSWPTARTSGDPRPRPPGGRASVEPRPLPPGPRRPPVPRLAFADLSAITLAERLPRPLATMLARADLSDRLLDGTDYPIPGIRIALRLGAVARHGFLPREEIPALAGIRRRNPLLFDFALKRLLRHPETGTRFPARVFGPHPDLPCC